MDVSDNKLCGARCRYLLKLVGLPLLVCVFAAIILYYVMSAYVIGEAKNSIRDVLLSHRGVHLYIQRIMLPEFYRAQKEGQIAQDYYAPAVFSSTFLVRNLHNYYNEERKRSGLPEIYYKMAADNPRNPVNKADAFESRLIRMFNEKSDLKEYGATVTIGGKRYLYYAKPFLRTGAPCLKCHGKREDAPAGLQALYPGQGGFGDKIGNIRAIESLRAPIDEKLHASYIVTGSLSAGLLALMLLVMFNAGLREAVRKRTASLATEIEERKHIEESLRLFRNLLDQSNDTIFIIDPETARLLDVNKHACDMLGYTRDELLKLRVIDIGTATTDPDAWARHVQATREKGYALLEGRHRRKDGTEFFVEINVKYITMEKSAYLLAVVRDLSERKKLEGQLLQSQKMESIGRLAGGVAHDFNNMLGVIMGHAELAMDKADPAQTLYVDLQEIRKAAERSSELTRQLLAFARKQTIAPQVLDLNETVGGMLKMLQRLIGEDIRLTWLPGVNLWPVKIDPSQIDQIMANLCVNARDAIADVGKLIIETGNVGFDGDYCRDHASFIPGDYVLLAVSDDGCGMEKETADRIFEPFFTTKEAGKGTGLGLATVYGIIKQNNGFINVYSEPDQGTTFRIYLPRHIGPAGPAQPEALPQPIRQGRETVLVVEDEPALLDLSRIMLEGQGYRVLTAGTPGEAMRLAEEHAGEIHLLMTDVVMPEMNGKELAQTLLARHPQLKCLFTSGYTANVIAHHGVLDAEVDFIQKPFSRKELAAKVREVLGDR